MKNHFFVLLFASLFLLTVPAVLTLAAGDEVEIELFEVFEFQSGNNPFGNPNQEGTDPPQPNDFRATITGRTLTINSGVHGVRVIVRKGDGTPVLNHQFVGGTVEQMPAAGNYSLEIQSGSLTLVGVFEAQ